MAHRLIRFILAMTVALVFTGQVEAATRHCARLAELGEIVQAAETGPCHDMVMDGQSSPPEAVAKDAGPGKQGTANARCECVAVLTVCAAPAAPGGSSRIAAYGWAAPGIVKLASIERAPDPRPPRI